MPKIFEYVSYVTDSNGSHRVVDSGKHIADNRDQVIMYATNKLPNKYQSDMSKVKIAVQLFDGLDGNKKDNRILLNENMDHTGNPTWGSSSNT